MKKRAQMVLGTLGVALLVGQIACGADITVWTDPVKAAAEHPDFLLQGEYLGKQGDKELGVQAADLNGGKFLVSTYQGGLPGAGWDGTKIDCQVLNRAKLKVRVNGLERVERVSETMGMAAPEGAIVMFDGKPSENVSGKISDGLLWAGSRTTKPVGSFTMHLEFRLPFKPGRLPSSQDRGNSGVYIFDNYECQVLDSFALDLDESNAPFETESRNTQWCGSFYQFKLPDVPMVFPPLAWQTYDVDFTAPVFENGEKVKNARITVHHNGVLIHDDVELPKGTGGGGSRPEKEKGIVNLQGHGNPVAYRNFWVLEK